MTGACPACRATRSRAAMTTGGYRFRRCRACASLWVENPPAAPDSATLYDDEAYYVNPDYAPPETGIFLGYRDYLADRHHIEAKFAEALAHLERLVEPGRLLDVGCGPGFLLSVARGRGWQARGLDLNRWAVGHAREQLGLEVEHGTLHEAGIPDDDLDAITMMDLIEHVGDPEALIAEAARVTRPDGVLALLTPDAGSPVSRSLRSRWPEVRRAPEHLVLFSVAGAAALLRRHGFDAVGWHSVGKRSSGQTLLADVAPALPRPAQRLAGTCAPALAGIELELDPHTKFVLYARLSRGRARGPAAPPARLPKRFAGKRKTEQAIEDELRALARARRLCDWMFEQFAAKVRGEVVEVGAGIGTFSERLLGAGAERALLIEPQAGCAHELERRFAGDPRVEIAREALPGSPGLAAHAGRCDFVLCQNVLEHIEDHAGAMSAMASALRPGGELGLLVPALPRLFGTLDVAYGHWRRYTPSLLRSLVEHAGLELTGLYYFNALGIPGWWLKNRTGADDIGPAALQAYEAVLRPWQTLERRTRPPVGLSLIVHARRRPYLATSS